MGLMSLIIVYFFFSPGCDRSALDGLPPIGNTRGCHCRRGYLPFVLQQVGPTLRPSHVWSGKIV
jgi:hypothetical protein